MTKSEIQEKLKIPQRTLERTVSKCEELGLLEKPEYVKSPTGGQQRDFSAKDFRALRDFRKDAPAKNELARRGVNQLNGNGIVPFPKSLLPPDAESLLQKLADSIGAAIKAELYTDEIYKLKDLPIPRKRALAAIHSGRLKAVLNHVDLGRGYRIKKSDWQKFLSGV